MIRSQSYGRIRWMLPVLALSVLALGDAQANVGRTTAVVPQAQGTPPGQVTRTLRPKLDVFMNERIQTSDGGVAQILFVDGTSLTVGPHSDLVIDRFAYNPETSTGELVGRLTRGVLRFVGGQVSKRGTVELSTPVAVIGVRGGIAVVAHDTADETSAFFLFGDRATVTGLGPGAQPGETRTITRAGYSTTVSANGLVADAAPIEPAELSAVLRTLEAREGISQTSRAAVEKSASSYAAADEEPTETAGPQSSTIPGAAEDAVRQAGIELPESRSPAALWIYDPVSSTASYPVPFSALEGLHGGRASQLIVVKQEGDDFEAGVYRGFYVSSHFAGKGAAQQAAVSVMMPYLYSSTASSGNVPLVVREVGAVRDPGVTDDRGPVTYGIRGPRREDNPGQGGTSAFTTTTPPDSFYLTMTEKEGTLDLYLSGIKAGGDHHGIQDHVLEFRLHDSIQLSPQGRSQTPDVWHGYATGMFEGRDRSGARFDYVMSTSGASPSSTVFVKGLPTDPFGGQFSLEYTTGNSGGTNSMRFDFGFRAGQLEQIKSLHSYGNSARLSTTRGVYVNDDMFAAISSMLYRPEDTSHVQRLIWVNDRFAYQSGDGVFDKDGQHAGANRTWLFSNATAPATGLLQDGVEFCDCPAARFGWWGGLLSYPDPDDVQRRDAVFPGAFVIGDLPDIADIPAVGTASYTGHAAATISSGNGVYAAVGGFSMEWDFARRTGTASITSLDDRNYEATGLTSPVANPRDFGGALSQVGGTDPASGSMNGSFFSVGDNPVVDVGGQFTVTSDGGYTATGAVAATSR